MTGWKRGDGSWRGDVVAQCRKGRREHEAQAPAVADRGGVSVGSHGQSTAHRAAAEPVSERGAAGAARRSGASSRSMASSVMRGE